MSSQKYSNLNSIPAFVDKIIVSGINRTDESLIKKQLVKLVNSDNVADLFENVKASKERLIRLGVFKSIHAIVDVSDDPTKRSAYKVTFNVEEKRTSARVSMTHGTDGVTRACGKFQLNNLAHRAETADIDIELGSNKLVSRFATISKPFEGNPYVRLSIGGTDANWDHYWAKFLRHERSAFTEVQTETCIGVHKFQWDATWRETEAKDGATPWMVRKESGSCLKTSLRHIFESDTRPDLVFPNYGYLCKLTQEMATISPGNFTVPEQASSPTDDRSLQIKFEGLLQKPVRLTDWLVGELTFSSGLAHSLTNHHIHIADRFFLGGPLELRGFQWRSVGPAEPLLTPYIPTIDSNGLSAGDVEDSVVPKSASSNLSPVGAEAFWLTGAHLYTPLPFWGAEPGSLASQFRLHGFCLAGSTLDLPVNRIKNCCNQSLSYLDTGRQILREVKGDPRVVLGCGLVIRLAGVIRMELNYCIPVHCQPGDQLKSGFTFGFGMYYM